MNDNTKKWLGMSIFNTLICIFVCIIMIFTAFLGESFWEIVLKLVMALTSSLQVVVTYICWCIFLLEKQEKTWNFIEESY